MTRLSDFAHRYTVSGHFSVAERIEEAIQRSSIDAIELALDEEVLRVWDYRLVAKLLKACAGDGNSPAVVRALHDLLSESNTDKLDRIVADELLKAEAEREYSRFEGSML
jgi:hypothetical protein